MTAPMQRNEWVCANKLHNRCNAHIITHTQVKEVWHVCNRRDGIPMKLVESVAETTALRQR